VTFLVSGYHFGGNKAKKKPNKQKKSKFFYFHWKTPNEFFTFPGAFICFGGIILFLFPINAGNSNFKKKFQLPSIFSPFNFPNFFFSLTVSFKNSLRFPLKTFFVGKIAGQKILKHFYILPNSIKAKIFFACPRLCWLAKGNCSQWGTIKKPINWALHFGREKMDPKKPNFCAFFWTKPPRIGGDQ